MPDMPTIEITGPARAAAIVAVVAELERCRERWHQQHHTLEQGGKVSPLDMETTAQAVDDLQAALDALRTATPTNNDQMSSEAVERTVGCVRDSYQRFLEANEARKAADAEKGIR